MTLLTPDLIEKAAEAIELAMWEEPSSEALARAALTAVIPDVVEAIAGHFAYGTAARIRALADLIPQEGK